MEKEYIKINRKAYNQFAKQHYERFENLKDENLSDSYWVELLKEIVLKKNTSNNVLEIGPGTGRLLKILSERLNCDTIAVDISEEMIKYAKLRSPKTKYIFGNILETKFDENLFDVIIMGALIHNFPKPDAVLLLELVQKWLKQDGRILLYTTIHDNSEEGYFEKKDYKENIVRFRKKYTEKELLKLLEKTNYQIVYQTYNEEKSRNKKWIIYVLEKQA